MDWALIVGIISLTVGVLLFWVGLGHWRSRKKESVSVIETTLLDWWGKEPLPLTKLDWFLKYLQAILGLTLGPFFALLGIAVILNELEIL